jgi:hypothetical protein
MRQILSQLSSPKPYSRFSQAHIAAFTCYLASFFVNGAGYE